MSPRPLAIQGNSLPTGSRRFSRRQREVLDEVEKIFFRDGLGVTVGELASRSGCSRRTLYQLAPNKEELFLLVLDRVLRRLGKSARRAAAAETTSQGRIEAFLGAGLPLFVQPSSAAFMEAVETYAPAAWLFEFHVSLAKDFLTESIEEGIASGEFRDFHPALAAEALVAAVLRVTEPSVLNANRIDSPEAVEEFFHLIAHGLSREPASAGDRRASSTLRRGGLASVE